MIQKMPFKDISYLATNCLAEQNLLGNFVESNMRNISVKLFCFWTVIQEDIFLI